MHAHIIYFLSTHAHIYIYIYIATSYYIHKLVIVMQEKVEQWSTCVSEMAIRENTQHTAIVKQGKPSKKLWIGKLLHCQDDNNGISKWNIYQHTLTRNLSVETLGGYMPAVLLLEYHWKESWTVCSHTQHIATSLYVLYRCMRKHRPSMNFKQNVTRQQFVSYTSRLQV